MKSIKKVLLRTAAALFVLALGIAAISFTVATSRDFDRFKEVASGLHGMKPGQSQDEILYVMGKPDFVRKDIESQKLSTSELPIGTNINDYLVWEWLPKAGHPNNLSVEYDASSRSVVMVSCIENQYMPACQTIAGISSLSIGGSEDYIEQRLGAPDSAKLTHHEDGEETKLLSYDALGLYFTMKARHIAVISKAEADPDFVWWFRHSQSW
ncbi:hypothetical protein AX768_02130 [Burkholderia sp. PAMC 28687]|uniref:hypothetical protein n=1 Tax=Burkholderia sp. PAMC 28687 TaxID=1795874 RepID=UPI0007842162|nr:hypothetical protein [Burkholderia sp. PAMC 28687]AMM13088.1 hypothetical protein AX768_02130 [Burkholderia sp. PAMC 28687]